jgi:hypothetical protein
MAAVEIDPGASVDLPNPYKFENICLVVAAMIGVLLAFETLVDIRDALRGHERVMAIVGLGVFAAMMAAVVWLGAHAMRQLRIVRTLDDIAPLAPLVTRGSTQGSPEADVLIDRIRQNALPVHPPRDPLGTLMISLSDRLARAPVPLQRMAQAEFTNLVLMLAIGIGMLVSLFLLSNSAAAPWVGLLYGINIAVVVAQALRNGRLIPFGPASYIALLMLSALLPVALGLAGHALPDLGAFHVTAKVSVALAMFVACCVLLLLVIVDQSWIPVRTPPACRQIVQPINFSPDDIGGQFAREIAEIAGNRNSWCYAGGGSGIGSQNTGSFHSVHCEESRPKVDIRLLPATIAEAFTKPGYRFLTMLTLLGAAAWIGFFLACRHAAGTIIDHHMPIDQLSWAGILLTIAIYIQRGAHLLWGRNDMESTLAILELSGTFSSFSASAGNRFTGSVQTDRRSVNVENLQLTLWLCSLKTIVFGIGQPRTLIGFEGPIALADSVMDHLQRFVAGQSIIVAPSTREDESRLGRLNPDGRPIGPPAGHGGIIFGLDDPHER